MHVGPLLYYTFLRQCTQHTVLRNKLSSCCLFIPERIGSHRKLDLSHAPESLPHVFVSPRQPYTGPSQPLSLFSFCCPCDSVSRRGGEEGEVGREKWKEG